MVAAADKVISLIDTKVLADWFAQKSEPEGEDAAKVSVAQPERIGQTYILEHNLLLVES